MLLTFSENLEKILDGTKTMTTRADLLGHYREVWDRTQAEARLIVLDMWWLNPRNRHPDCYKIGRVYWEDMDAVRGSALSESMARRDGFETLEEYLLALERLNGMSREEVLEYKWTLIMWRRDGWLEGPFRRGDTEVEPVSEPPAAPPPRPYELWRIGTSLAQQSCEYIEWVEHRAAYWEGLAFRRQREIERLEHRLREMAVEP